MSETNPPTDAEREVEVEAIPAPLEAAVPEPEVPDSEPEAAFSDVVAAEEADGTAEDDPEDGPVELEPAKLRAALESVLLVVDAPTSASDLARAVQRPIPEIEAALAELAGEYDGAERGFQLREVAGGWRLYTREEFASYVERFVLDGQRARLTQAALETLAVIAYRQPVTRSRISAIRGVGVDGVMRTLLTRGLVVEEGTDPETNGGLYRTTSLFLERLGLRSLDELPPLAPLLPDVGPNADELLDSDALEHVDAGS